MEYFNWILQQDFNRIYTNVENCSITKPPYLDWRVPQTFYFTKRWGFEENIDEGYDEIFEVLDDWIDTYIIWKIWTNLVVKKNSTALYTEAYSYERHYKFIYGPWVIWTSVEYWAMANSWDDGTPTEDPLNYWLEDTAKNRTADQWLWKYVYVYDADNWYWEVKKILWNTATQLIVNWFQQDVINWTYKIFEEFSEALYFVGSDGFYWIHSDTDIIKVKWYWDVMDVVFAHDTFFAINTVWQVFKWWPSYLLLFINDESFIVNKTNILRLVTFNDYVLLLSSHAVSLIKKEVLTFSDNTTKDIYTSSLVTREFWIFDENSVETYNNWLYIFDNNKKFVSVNITPVTDTRFTTEVKDEWIYIQKDLDNIIPGSSVSIDIDPNEIKIINQAQPWQTDIYIYDRYYLGWHKWTTGLEFKKYYWPLDIYYWGKGYKVNSLLKTDFWSLEITQVIKLLFWEENMTSFKRVIYNKLILGTKTDPEFKIQYDIISWSDSINFTKIAKWINLLTQQQIAEWTWDTALWQTLIWLWVMGWSEDTELVQNLYPSVWTVKIPFWTTLELLQFSLIAEWEKKIGYGWQVAAYEVLTPNVTDVKNVI